jgi:hypothetical protein
LVRSDLPDTVFAFPRERKEPLTDASHVRNAVARFDQVLDAPDADRELAVFRPIYLKLASVNVIARRCQVR